MKDYLIFAIFLFIEKHRKTTAKEIADHFELSTRSVYRYINSLSLLGIPVVTKLGKGGGIEMLNNVYLESIRMPKKDKETLNQFLIDEKLTKEVKNIIQKIVN